MDALNSTWENLRGWWQSAPPMTRAAATGMALLVVIGLVVAGSLAATPDYQAIYHNVSGKDASAIENVLREHNIPMHFADHDGTVSVPSKDEGNATMYVEAAGILSKEANIVGIESLDKIGLGTSTDVERKRILEADEGELARKLMRIDAVETAAVTISPGSTSSLFSNDSPASASVILTVKSGENLNPNMVKGIVFLIVKAVPGLTSQNVALSDQSGAPLWKDNGLGENSLGDGQPLDESARYAERIRRKLQDNLDELFGPRKSIVMVNAELDVNQSQTHFIKHSPVPGTKTGLPVSVRTKEENYTGNGPKSGGAAGTGSNMDIPSYTSSANGSGGKYGSSDNVTNYENNVEDTVQTKTAGGVKQLTVSAMIDASVPIENIPKIKDILGMAIGMTPETTGRAVTVQQIAFDTSGQKARTAQMQADATQKLWSNIALALAVSVVAIVLLVLLLRPGRRAEASMTRTASGRTARAVISQAGSPAQSALSSSDIEKALDAASEKELEGLLEERPLSIDEVLSQMPEADNRPHRRRAHAPAIEEQQNLKMESIQTMIASSPEAVALLIKGWMTEEPKII